MKKMFLLIIMGLTLPGLQACRAKAPEQKSLIPLREHKEQPKSATKQHIGTKEIDGDIRSKCPGYKTVDNFDATTPEGIIFKAYQAVLANDLTAFTACFDPRKNKKEIERFYWKNVKKYIGKYTKSKDNASFAICRKEKYGKGTKIFIVSKDPKKSHPPIILKKLTIIGK